MASLVRYLAVGRLVKGPDGKFKEEKHQIVASLVSKKDDPSAASYKAHVKAIMNKGAAKLEPGKRIRLTSDDNAYDLHVFTDMMDGYDTTIVFFAVTELDFGKHFSVSKLLQDLKDGFYDASSKSAIVDAVSSGVVSNNSQPLLTKLVGQYAQSKLQAVQGKVDQVRDLMKDNVQKALSNVEKLEDMEEKSEQFEDAARQFQKSSVQIKREMRCRYYKITALIVLLVAIALTVIIVPIVIKNQKKDE